MPPHEHDSPTIEQLKMMLALHEERAHVQRQLDTIDERLAALQNQVFSGAPQRRGRRSSTNASQEAGRDHQREEKSRAEAANGGPKSSGRGELRRRIESALATAGESGLSVKELAESAGTNYKNVAVWFSTTGKKNGAIEKLGPARYRLATMPPPELAQPPSALASASDR